MTTKFPNNYDNFQGLPDGTPIDNTAQLWNSLYDACETIEAEIGAGVGGAFSDLSGQLAVNFDQSGHYKNMAFGSHTGTVPFFIPFPNGMFDVGVIPYVLVQLCLTGNEVFDATGQAVQCAAGDIAYTGFYVDGRSVNNNVTYSGTRFAWWAWDDNV